MLIYSFICSILFTIMLLSFITFAFVVFIRARLSYKKFIVEDSDDYEEGATIDKN